MMWRLYVITFLLLLFVFKAEAVFVVQKPKWKTATVLKLVDNERFMLKSGKVIRIIGIKAPDIFLQKGSDRCYARPIYRTLDDLITGKKVKIFENGKRDKGGDFPRHVKLKDRTVLTTYMLERGMARLDKKYQESKYFKVYEKAENLAKKYRLGIWRGCNPWNNLKKRRKISGRYPSLWKKYYLYLTNVSVGRVTEVISGNSFRLENGLIIKMIGVEVPDISDDRVGYSCFGQSGKLYLESLILGKKVRLVRDRSQLDEDGNLLRYVYLPQTKYRNGIFLNKKIIQDGYGKSSWNNVDKQFEEEFELIQKDIYQNPNGAWVSCISKLLNQDIVPIKKEKVLEYDEDCRIKGNISGSKKNPVKTYHTPKSGWYKRIEAEECFENEDEAIMSGFRKIK